MVKTSPSKLIEDGRKSKKYSYLKKKIVEEDELSSEESLDTVIET